MEDPYHNERKEKVHAGAKRDPIAFYNEIEHQNLDLQERHRKASDEREKQRLAYRSRRAADRERHAACVAEEQKRVKETGEDTTSLERLKKKDQCELKNSFERFVTKASTFDNSLKAQDNEWWKKDENRRDYEKTGKRGVKWNAVQEFGGAKAPEVELATRVEWYKSQCWWKTEKYRNDWIKTRGLQWWKETPYVLDWQNHRAKGTMWTAADEMTGFNGKGQMHAAHVDDLNRRIEWYKANGPIGLKKIWNALEAGSTDRCTLEEKCEREDYYRNGDWWRSDDEYRKYNKMGAGCNALKYSGPAGCDREWWKEEKYRHDFNTGGEMWKCVTETAIQRGQVMGMVATISEQEKRAEWFKENWWKAEKYVNDYKKNGSESTLWRCRTEENITSGNLAQCKESEAMQRELWYKSAEDREWWKDEEFRQDYELNGNKGQKWMAVCAEMGASCQAREVQASDAEKKMRQEWYDKNWWKSDGLTRNFHNNGTYWKASNMHVSQDKEWWKQPMYREDWKRHSKEVLPDDDFWKGYDAIDDFQTNGDNGTIWTAIDALNGSVGNGISNPASSGELARRKQWLQVNWWRALRFQYDWAAKGIKGTLWTSANENTVGSRMSMTSVEELRKRQEAYGHSGPAWRALTETDGFNREADKYTCSRVEALDRARWYKENWWKNPEARDDFEKNGLQGILWTATSEEAANVNEDLDSAYRASADELSKRTLWFQQCGDIEYWKDPKYIHDYEVNGWDGALWQAQSSVDAHRAMGKEHQADENELKFRETWYKKNHWKSPNALNSFQKECKNGNKWQAETSSSDIKASDEELKCRADWLHARAVIPQNEQDERAKYFGNRLTDEEIKCRYNWLNIQTKEDKHIYFEELQDCLQMLNQGMPPTEEQTKAVEEKLVEHRSISACVDPRSVSQEEFMHAVAEAGFYITLTEEETKMNEEEAVEEIEKEEAARVEEEAAFLAMEAEEERRNAGHVDEDLYEDADEEEARYIAEQEQPREPPPNEDDVETEELFGEEFEMTPDSLPTVGDEETERRENEDEDKAARKEAEEEAWKQEQDQGDNIADEEGEHDNPYENEHLAEELHEDEHTEEQEVEAEIQSDEKPVTNDDVLPEKKITAALLKLALPNVTKPQFLKKYFNVLKCTKSNSLFGGTRKRIWLVDHFSRSFYEMDQNGNLKKEYPAMKLLQLEKNWSDPTRVRLMFLHFSHTCNLVFLSTEERERFIETASAIRQNIRVYAPFWKNDDILTEMYTTVIDGIGANSMTVTESNGKNDAVECELTGECKINTSTKLRESVTVWVGTFNLSGAAPPQFSEMSKWVPKDKFDIYAIATQETSYQREGKDWIHYVQDFMGPGYLPLAHMELWDLHLIVMTRKKNILKITNIEGSSKATNFNAMCGTKGGVGIAFQYHNTSICFVACHLASRPERTALRNKNIEELVDGLQFFNNHGDFTHEFDNVFFFGDFNYRIDMDEKEVFKCIKDGTYEVLLQNCQLNTQRRELGILHGFNEAPINFPPTYRLTRGSADYSLGQSSVPSFTDRIFVKTASNTHIRCLSYECCQEFHISEHLPLSASFTLNSVRPCLSCFSNVQTPKVRFTFPEVRVIQNDGALIKTPGITLITRISESPHFGKVLKTPAKLPVWSGTELPVIDVVNHMPEFLETHKIVIILRNNKTVWATACLSLMEAIEKKQGVEQNFTLNLCIHGTYIGKLAVKFKWISR